MKLTDIEGLFEGRKKFRMSDAQRAYAFVFSNLWYQELRPRFRGDYETIEEIIRLLSNDSVCPIQDLSPITIRRFLSITRGRREPGQWHFKRHTDPVTGREFMSVSQGRRHKYLHPSIRDKQNPYDPVYQRFN